MSPHRSDRDDRDATEFLESIRPAGYDGRTWEWAGASDVGIMAAPVAETEPATAPMTRLRVHRPKSSGPSERAPVADDTARGWARIFTIGCEYPAAPGGITIPCDQQYRDDRAGSYPALYRSAWDAGWRMDALYQWACPHHARYSGAYQALYPVQHWHPAAPAARDAGDAETEFRLRVAAENVMVRDVLDRARQGRHRRAAVTAGAR